MSMAQAELQALRLVVKGVKRAGGYICLLATPEIRRATERCRLVGATEVEIRAAIEVAYCEDERGHHV